MYAQYALYVQRSNIDVCPAKHLMNVLLFCRAPCRLEDGIAAPLSLLYSHTVIELPVIELPGLVVHAADLGIVSPPHRQFTATLSSNSLPLP